MTRDGFGFEALLSMATSDFRVWFGEWESQRKAEAEAAKAARGKAR